MDRQTVIVTGAAGFLGAAITIDLARDHNVVGLDRREPSDALKAAAPGVDWAVHDIADAGRLGETLRTAKAKFGDLHHIVHFAAYYDFDVEWQQSYQRNNVDAVAGLIELAAELGVGRILFASSLAALDPPPPGELLTAETAPSVGIAYGKSKCLGEELFRQASDRVASVALRIGGVFTEWCELPPLYSLIRTWSAWGPIGRVVPGRGESGFPYIHRSDLVSQVRAIIAKSDELAPHEVFIGARQGVVSHNQLFPVIRPDAAPIHVPPALLRLPMHARCAWGRLIGRVPYERPWMLDYVDRPLAVDIAKTETVLDWRGQPGKDVLSCLPAVLANRQAHPRLWEERNVQRNEALYAYY